MGIIRVANARGRTGANDLRQVEGTSSRIGSGNKQPADRVPSPLNKSAFSHGVVSRVFSRYCRYDRLRHVVLYRTVDENVPIVFTVALSALPKRRLRFASHIDS